jgi:hypothetical protein
LYDGLSYGEARSDAASPSGYLRFREADGGVSGSTVGSRLSSFTIGAAADEMDRRRTEEDNAGVEGAVDAGGGGGGADAGAGTGRVHLISQGGGGGMCPAGAFI